MAIVRQRQFEEGHYRLVTRETTYCRLSAHLGDLKLLTTAAHLVQTYLSLSLIGLRLVYYTVLNLLV